MSELEIELALRQLVDAARRLAPDYCVPRGVPQTTDEELDLALARAEAATNECADAIRARGWQAPARQAEPVVEPVVEAALKDKNNG